MSLSPSLLLDGRQQKEQSKEEGEQVNGGHTLLSVHARSVNLQKEQVQS